MLSSLLKKKRIFEHSLSYKKQYNKKKTGKIQKESFNQYKLSNILTYVLDGTGTLTPLEGTFHFQGYIASAPVLFNYVADYPLSKSTNPNNNIVRIKIDGGVIGNNKEALDHVSPTPASLDLIDYDKYSVFFICGKKNSGKSTFTPYIINRILSENKNVYYLDCDIAHHYIPYLNTISLIKIEKPLLTNSPILPSEYYTKIRSVYISDESDIKTNLSIIKKLFDLVELSNEKNSIVINCYSNWECNPGIYNSLIYKDLVKSNEKGCAVYFKNNFIKEKEEANSIENILFNDKVNSFLFAISNANYKDTKAETFTIENNFDHKKNNEEMELQEKKRQHEINCVMYHYKNRATIKTISLSKLHLFYDSIFVDKSQLKFEEILKMLLNKHCALFLKKHNEKYNRLIDVAEIKNFDIASYCKVVDVKGERVDLYTDIDIKEEEEIFIYLDNRIEKAIKETKKEMFFKYLTNASFKFDITKKEEAKMNNVIYLSRNSYNLI